MCLALKPVIPRVAALSVTVRCWPDFVMQVLAVRAGWLARSAILRYWSISVMIGHSIAFRGMGSIALLWVDTKGWGIVLRVT